MPSSEGKFTIKDASMGQCGPQNFWVEHVADIQIGYNTVVDGKVARRVPTAVMANMQTHEVYELGDVHDHPGEPLSTSGFIFPFDERCFVDKKGTVHSAAGFTTAIVDTLRMVEHQKEPAHRSLVMSRQVFQALEGNHETRPILEGLKLLDPIS